MARRVGSWNVHSVLPVAGSSETTVRRGPDDGEQHAVDVDRQAAGVDLAELDAGIPIAAPLPRDFQRVEVRGVDLVERRIAGGGVAAGDVRPPSPAPCLLCPLSATPTVAAIAAAIDNLEGHASNFANVRSSPCSPDLQGARNHLTGTGPVPLIGSQIRARITHADDAMTLFCPGSSLARPIAAARRRRAETWRFMAPADQSAAEHDRASVAQPSPGPTGHIHRS